MVLTKKINQKKLNKILHGFISWYSNSTFEQREIGAMISIGRDSSQTILLDDPFISRHHARIESKAHGEYVLTDMSSRNGTFLNGNKIYKAVLKNNDRIKIGKTEFVFSVKRFNYDWKIFHQSLNLYWNKQLKRLPSMAESGFPVLIYGASGTGKEYLARMIHTHSSRSAGPYVSVNCSALTETLAESELFGHLRGSYTGAERDRKGAFLSAHGGTLFLDEVGDLPIQLQPKLLRALESKEVKPVGSDQIHKVDVRVVSATHQNLLQKIYEKTFREDLYFRLRVLEIKPPSLKDRIEDFDELLDFFSSDLGVTFSKEARKYLKNYTWPGNIRELRNATARARALFPGQIIEHGHIREILDALYDLSDVREQSQTGELPLLKQMEKDMIVRVLQEKKGSQSQAAVELRMARSTLREKLKLYGLLSKDNLT